MEKKKADRYGMAVVILAILLAASLGYIVIAEYNKMRQNERDSWVTEGVKTGYQQAIFQLMTEAEKCGEVPIYYGNKSITIVSVDCIGK